MGSRLTFFVRHAEFVASDDDPTEPSSGDDDNPTEPSSGDDDSQASDRTVTEPLNLVLGEDIVVDSGIAIQNGMGNGTSCLGLDESFERALNDLGLTTDEANVISSNK